jgi:hypothetical protein
VGNQDKTVPNPERVVEAEAESRRQKEVSSKQQAVKKAE